MPLRILRFTVALALAASLGAVLAGCQGGRKTLPKTTVNVVNAAPTMSTLSFLREERVEATLDFRATSGDLSFDADTYDFHVEVTPPDTTTPSRIATFTETLASGTDYLFVLAEVNGSVEPIKVEAPTFSSTSQTQVAAVDAAASVSSADVYVVPAGTDPASASPLGNVSFQGSLAPAALDPGDYQVVLTEPGNPANVEFRSPPITLDAGQSNTFVIVADPSDVLAPLSVVDSGPAASVLIDQNAPSGVEVANVISDGGARDVYLDGDFTTPIASAVPSPGVSMLVTVPAGSHTLSVTPAGNPGVIEIEQTFTAQQDVRLTELVEGDPGSLSVTGWQNDTRAIAGQARLRFMDGASLFAVLDVYVLPPGTDISTALPLVEVAPPQVSSRFAFAPGDYELTVQDPSTSTVVAGPETVTLTEGLSTILLSNGTDSSTAQVVPLEGFQ